MKCSVWFPWNEATKIIANIHWAFVISYYYSYLHNKKKQLIEKEKNQIVISLKIILCTPVPVLCLI